MLKKILKKYLSLTGILIILVMLITGGFILFSVLRKSKTEEIAEKQEAKIKYAEKILFEKYAQNLKNITASERMIKFFVETGGEINVDSSRLLKISAVKKDKEIIKTFVLPEIKFSGYEDMSLKELADKFTYLNNTFTEIWQKSGDDFVKIADSKPSFKDNYEFINKKDFPANKILKGENITSEEKTPSGITVKKIFPVYSAGEIKMFISAEINENILPAAGKIFNNDLTVFDKEGNIIFGNENNFFSPENIILAGKSPEKFGEINISDINGGKFYFKYIPEFSVFIGFFVSEEKIPESISGIKSLIIIFTFLIFAVFSALFILYDYIRKREYETLLKRIRKITPSRKKIPNEKVLAAFSEYFAELRSFASQIASGNYKAQVCENFKDDDLVKNLIRIQNKFAETEESEKNKREELLKKAEFDKVTAEISEILQYATDIDDLAFKIIKKISEFTGAEQSALFVVKEDFKQNKSLELTASYAYSKNRTVNKTLEVNEGLIGRAYLEKQSIFLTEIPEDYTFIESGFGFQKPSCLLLVPLIFNNDVQAVIEIGSINLISEEYVKFLENTGENIASTIANLKHSKQTEILLKQTREQSEEIENQRRTLEEKINTHRKQNRNLDKQILQLIEIIDSIKSVSYLIEYDLKGAVMDVSSKFMSLFDAKKKDFISKSHKDIVVTEDYDSEYKEFWDKLLNKKIVETEETLMIGEKKITFKQTYVPIKNVRRKIYRILSIGTIKE